MKRLIAIFSLIPLTLLDASPVTKPNFVVILGEGHGWTSTSVQMDDAVPNSKSSIVRTPSLEKLAQGGMRFANYYSPSPRCTPTRASLFTGKSPAQLHMTFVNEGKQDGANSQNGKLIPPPASIELSTDEITIAELLHQAGYATAHFGKWHMGRVNPNQHGYDESDGANGNGGPDNVANPHPKQLNEMTRRGIDFMTRQSKSNKPFYLQLSHYATRQGGAASPEAIAIVKSWGGNWDDRTLEEAAADLDLDLALDKLLKQIDALGISHNTYVIFTTDHGTPGKNPPLAGGKGTVSDGGLRVPLIIRGPGIQGGTCCHIRTIGEDLMPTIAELAKVKEPLPAGIEGGSMAALLTNGGKGSIKRPRDEFVVHFPHYDKDPSGPASAIFLGDYKLIRIDETNTLKLYQIIQDPEERNNLAAKLPEKTKELNQRLSDYLTAIHAQLPKANPAYDPSKPTQERRGGRRKEKP